MRKAWKKVIHNKFTIVVLIALMLIPSIYNVVFLGSIWDPYGKMDKMPVAVVNNDRPVDFNGKTVSIGDTLSDNLIDNKAMDFQTDSMSSARKKLKDGRYYMIVEIPDNFSENATTVLDENPKKAVIHYYTNPAKSFMGAKFTESGMTQMKNSVSNEVTRNYADILVSVVKSSSKGIQTAADGSTQINDGSNKLKDGSQQVTSNLDKLSASTLTFVSGSEKVNKGLQQYTSGVAAASKASKSIADGSAQLSNGVSQLKGLENLGQVSGAIDQLSENVSGAGNDKSLKAGADSLSAGLKQLSDAQTKAGQQTVATVNSINGALDQAIAEIDESSLSDEEKTSLVNSLKARKISSEAVQKSTAAMGQAIDNAASGAAQLDKGVGTLGNALNQLSTSTASFPEAAEGVKQLEAGSAKLADGSAQLQSGLDKISQNNDELVSGQSKLTKGAGKIADGSSKLAAGSGQITENLGKLNDGTEKLSKGLNKSADRLDKQKVSKKTAKMFAEPVNAKETKMTDVKANGYGMAPYMMSVGLWVVCIASCMILPVRERDKDIRNGVEWYVSKVSVLYPLVLASGIVMLIALHGFLGFTPLNMGQMIITTLVTGLAFMSIFTFLNISMGPIGSYIGLILTVIQLSASGGTYPLEISSHYAGYIHDYIPFTYSVDAFRAAIAGNTSIKHDMTVLGVIAIVFTLLSLLIYVLKDQKARVQEDETEGAMA